LVVNHRRRILGTTDGHPARWNDKSLVKFDTIAMDLHEGTYGTTMVTTGKPPPPEGNCTVSNIVTYSLPDVASTLPIIESQEKILALL